MTPFQRVAAWLAAAGKTADDVGVQFGVHLEEFVELLDNVVVLAGRSPQMQADYEGAKGALRYVSAMLKGSQAKVFIANHNRVDVLDALVDGTVTAMGMAALLQMQFDPALADVLDSNDSKFVDGKPVLLPGGKIGKGPSYRPPNLKGFV